MINRIILIGNGFDLAHGMKTMYKDFMKSYWNNSFTEYHNCPETIYKCNEYELETSLKKNFNSSVDYLHYLIKNKNHLKINNKLFIELSEFLHVTDWVDIETFFYERLKKSETTGLDNNVLEVNKNFEGIKLLLEAYLQQQVLSKPEIERSVSDHIKDLFYGYIYLRDLSEQGLMNVTDIIWAKINGYIGPDKNPHLDPYYLSKFERGIVKEIGNTLIDKNFLFDHLKDKRFNETVPLTFLNFNYTDTEQIYCEEMDEVIHIHGELGNQTNSIIFGYGDELDDDFKVIEKLNNNDYLENIKSINYSRTANYKNLLKTLNSGMYQVLVVGHSCGNTDRTLLNTIFEHDNCVSVKILYHQRSANTDNYIDVYKNISRNFNDKTLLRDRVVNKTYSEPLVPFSTN